MTTYLATIHPGTEDEVTRAYCSPRCRWADWPWPGSVSREDDHYEFDETCAYCGVLVVASKEGMSGGESWTKETP